MVPPSAQEQTQLQGSHGSLSHQLSFSFAPSLPPSITKIYTDFVNCNNKEGIEWMTILIVRGFYIGVYWQDLLRQGL